jgi:hypothetical protein
MNIVLHRHSRHYSWLLALSRGEKVAEMELFQDLLSCILHLFCLTKPSGKYFSTSSFFSTSVFVPARRFDYR